jgi:hypothetical protein
MFSAEFCRNHANRVAQTILRALQTPTGGDTRRFQAGPHEPDRSHWNLPNSLPVSRKGFMGAYKLKVGFHSSNGVKLLYLFLQPSFTKSLFVTLGQNTEGSSVTQVVGAALEHYGFSPGVSQVPPTFKITKPTF